MRPIAIWSDPVLRSFGVNPTPGHRNPMRPVVGLQARILQVRSVPKGETIGYSASWTAKHATRIAVVGAGYADGYPRAASATDAAPGSEAIVAGVRCPLAGRVSMDLLAIDITAVSDTSVRRGDLVTLIGGDLGVDELAAAAGHHRLRNSHGPRSALPADLPVALLFGYLPNN